MKYLGVFKLMANSSLGKGHWSNSIKEGENMVVDIVIGINGPHIVKMIVVIDVNDLSCFFRNNFLQLLKISFRHKHIVSSNEEHHWNIGEPCLE